MSKKPSEIIEAWLEKNAEEYLRHNKPSPVTLEAIKHIEKNIDDLKTSIEKSHDKIEGHVEKIFDRLDKTYTKTEVKSMLDDLNSRIDKKADKWIITTAIGSIIGAFIAKIFGLF